MPHEDGAFEGLLLGMSETDGTIETDGETDAWLVTDGTCDWEGPKEGKPVTDGTCDSDGSFDTVG